MLFRIYESLKPENLWNWNPFEHGVGYLIVIGVAFMVGWALRSAKR